MSCHAASQAGFGCRLHAAPRELGLDAPLKLATSLAAEEIRRVRGLGMTYCCGILVRDGLVMIADTRTNAGLDNVSTFRKLLFIELLRVVNLQMDRREGAQ